MAGKNIFNSDTEIKGKVIIYTVPNATGTVLTYNPTTKEVSTRTNAELIADMNLMTTNTIQNVTGRKEFITIPGNDSSNNSLWVTSDANTSASMTFYRIGTDLGQIRYTDSGVGFSFVNSNNSSTIPVTALQFRKSDSNNNYFLLGGGGHQLKSDFVLNSDLPTVLSSYHKIDPADALYNASSTHINHSWFDYGWAGTTKRGSVINFSGLFGNYSSELFVEYDVLGNYIGVRSKNGDTNTWNDVKWLNHSKSILAKNISNVATTLDSELPNGGFITSYYNGSWGGTDRPVGASYGGYIKHSSEENGNNLDFYYNNGHSGSPVRLWFRTKEAVNGITPWLETYHSGNLNLADYWNTTNLPQTHVDYLSYLISVGAATQSDLLNYIPLTQKATANGVATLDGSGLIPTNQIPGYHTHSNLANLDSIDQNLGTTNLPTFSSLRVNSSSPFLHGAVGSTNLFIIGADNAIGGGAPNILSYYTYGGGGYHKFYQDVEMIADLKVGNFITSVNGFIKQGGTSTQFLKADGSVDSNTYSTTTQLDNKVNRTGDTMTGALNINSHGWIGKWKGADNNTNYLAWRNFSDTKDIAYIGADGNSAVSGGVGDGFGINAASGDLIFTSNTNLIKVFGQIVTNNHGTSFDWYTAYAWGDHNSAGYVKPNIVFTATTGGELLLSDGYTNNESGIVDANNDMIVAGKQDGFYKIGSVNGGGGGVVIDIATGNMAYGGVMPVPGSGHYFNDTIRITHGIYSETSTGNDIYKGDGNFLQLDKEIVEESASLRLMPFDRYYTGTSNSFDTDNRRVRITLRDGGTLSQTQAYLHQEIVVMNPSAADVEFIIVSHSVNVSIPAKSSATYYVNEIDEVVQVRLDVETCITLS